MDFCVHSESYLGVDLGQTGLDLAKGALVYVLDGIYQVVRSCSRSCPLVDHYWWYLRTSHVEIELSEFTRRCFRSIPWSVRSRIEIIVLF